MEPSISERLAIEEFNQLHQHMRQREEAMNQLLNLSVTGSTTILAAVAAYAFQLSTAVPNKLEVYHCYLFLAVMPVLVFGLAMLAAHRTDIYRMGYYLNVFFEERWGGAEWGVRSFRFRELMKGESQDPIALVFWSLFAAASSLFLFCLSLTNSLAWPHAIALLPFAFALAVQHRSFRKDRRPMKAVWQAVLTEQGLALKANKSLQRTPDGPAEVKR